MNKKFLSAILFGALMVTSTGTFVSCKDYDDDIEDLQTQVSANADAIKKLQDLVGAGNWVTGVTATANGISVTMSNGQTTEITSIKGEDGKDGVDGKNGTVVTIVDGFWAFDGVKSEYRATPEASTAGKDAHEIKVSENGYWMIWNTEKEAYEETPYAAAPVSATQNADGSWTISVKNNGKTESIVIPATALAHIEVINKNSHDDVNNDWWSYNYGIVREDVKWGWNEDKTMGAGMYSKLGTDALLLLNPAGVHGDAYSYTLKNSNGDEAPVKFFETADEYTGPALARSISSNGLWVLPAHITKSEASKIETLRRNLYLYFKNNDGKYYDLAVEASNAGAKVFSDYSQEVRPYGISGDETLYSMGTVQSLINKPYYPVFSGDAAGMIYDYELRLTQTADNLKKAEVYGAKVVEDGHALIATKEAGVYNGIKFDIMYILLDGSVKTIKNAFVTVNFTAELTTPNKITLEDPTLYQGAPLNATWNKDRGVFEYTTKEYDLAELVSEMSDVEKLVWNQAVETGRGFSTTLIGGDGENNVENNNWIVENNITYAIKDNKIKFTFFVSNGFYANFDLDKAYQYTITVVDPDNAAAGVAEITLPFEFTQPTLDINRVDGNYTTWSGNNLLAYGYRFTVEGENYMGLQLHDAFNAWKPVAGTVTAPFQQYVENAKYYGMSFNVPALSSIFGQMGYSLDPHTASLDSDLMYAGKDEETNTWAPYELIKNNIDDADEDEEAKLVELTVPVTTDYKFYGVYPATKEQVSDFTLVFASWLKRSVLKTTKDTYVVDRGETNAVLLTNADIDFTSPKGTKFYLFDGIKEGDATKLAKRSEIAGSTNEYNHYPFTGYSADKENDIEGLFSTTVNHFSAVQAGNKTTPVTVVPKVLGEDAILVEESTGKRYIDPTKIEADDDNINVYLVPSVAQNKDTDVIGGIAKAFTGGMLVQLPNKGIEQDGVELTVTLYDYWGYTNNLKFIVKKAQ